MIKKLLSILLLSIPLIIFSQEKNVTDLSTAPNPFTNTTEITFNAPLNASIILKVRNILGKTVFKKIYTVKSGKNNITFYKKDIATGMYIYSIQNQNKIISKRFIIQ
jgi:hypothetical protein